MENFIANKSIAGIFYAVFIVFISSFVFQNRKTTLLLLTPIAILIGILIYSNSRSGLVGCAAGFFYSNYIAKKKVIELLPVIFFLLAFFLSLLFHKKDSTKGREHVYSVSFQMFKENWVRGVGVNKFKAHFNEYQADYFSKNNIDNKRALLADNTFYAFNDYLQWGIETGLPGLILLISTACFFIKRIRLLQVEHRNKPIVTAAAAGLICIGTASLFSYPMQVWQIQFLALVFIGIITFFPLKHDKQSLFGKGILTTIRLIYIVLACLFLFTTLLLLKRNVMAKNAFELARTGYRTEAIQAYKKLTTLFPVNGYNNFLLAEQLYYSNRLAEAMIVLQETKKIYVDNRVYKLKAQIENELGKYQEAEKSYLRALYMVPNRMSSRFDLMNFYISRKDTANAISWANSLLKMPVKVPSERTETMLRTTKEVLSKLEKYQMVTF